MIAASPAPQATVQQPQAAAQPLEVLRCTTTADFLAALPMVTGFTAENSIFIALFHDQRSEQVLRLDLPDADDAGATTALIDGIVSLLRDTGAGSQQPGIVLNTSRRFTPNEYAPYTEFALRLAQHCRRQRWNLRELAIVAANGWCSLLYDPVATRRPLSEIRESPVAHDAKRLRSHPVSLARLGALPAAHADRAAAVAAALLKLSRVPASDAEQGTVTPAQRRSSERLHRVGAITEACLTALGAQTAPPAHQANDTRDAVTPQLLADLIDAAQSVERWVAIALTSLTDAACAVRIVTQVNVVLNTERAHGGVETRTSRSTVPPSGSWSMQELLFTLSHEQPGTQRIRAAICLFEDAVVHAPRTQQPAVLALLAWAWWMRGMQSVSKRFILRAFELEPKHQLTRMVHQLTAHPPAYYLHRMRQHQHVA